MKKGLSILITTLLTISTFAFVGFLIYKNFHNNNGTSLFQTQSNGLETRISQNEGSSPQIQVTNDSNTAKVTMNTTASGVTTNGNQTTFTEVYPNTDAVYTKVSNGIKEDIVLNQKPTVQPVYNFSLDTGDMTIHFFEDQYYFFDKYGYAKLTVPKPFMTDAVGVRSEAVTISIQKVGKGYKSTLVPDFNWLSSSERVYPVKIDPSVVVPESSIREVAEQRTLSAKTYDLGGGRHATTSGLSAIHYQDESGSWKEIDTTIVPSNDPEYNYMNITNNFQVFFSTDGFGNKKAVKFQVDDAYMKFSLVGASGVGEKANTDAENVFSFNDVYTNGTKTMDANYILSDTKLLEEVVLNQFQGYPELKQEIELSNAYLKMEGRAINAYHKKTNKLLWVIPEPVMYEVANPEVRNYGLHYEITPAGENVILAKVLDQEGKDWLSDPTRSYPLVIDTTAGPNSPGTIESASSGEGELQWVGPNSAMASDNAYAAANAILHFILFNSYYLKATNFGFSIPTGAAITGIKVDLERKALFDSESSFVKDNIIQIIKSNGSFGTTNKANSSANWSITEAYYPYGGETDLWGETWAAADINDTDFGVVLKVSLTNALNPNAPPDRCLSPDTKITAINGDKRIDTIKMGDEVLSYNQITGELAFNKVTNVWSVPNSDGKYHRIYYDKGKWVDATWDHKFYVNGVYVEARDLKVGDKLLSKSLQEQPIEKIEIIENVTEPVWDLTVENNHNFFANGVLSHNNNMSAYVDHIRITVYYTGGEGGGATVPTINLNSIDMNGITIY
jgi:hypothetical protein